MPWIRTAAALSLLLGAAPARPEGVLGTGREDAVAPELTGAPVPLPPPALPGHERASGAAYVGYQGADGELTGAIVTFAPWWKTFARVGLEATPRARDDEVRFPWEVGVGDGRPGSFFVNAHDWGATRPGHLTLRTAEATAGYEAPRPCAGPFCVAPTALVAMPFSGGPYVGGRATVTVAGTWFVAGGLGWTLPGVLPGGAAPPRWRVSFALGRWDSRPGGLFVTYRDDVALGRLRPWGTRERQGHGAIALGVNGAF